MGLWSDLCGENVPELRLSSLVADVALYAVRKLSHCHCHETSSCEIKAVINDVS